MTCVQSVVGSLFLLVMRIKFESKESIFGAKGKKVRSSSLEDRLGKSIRTWLSFLWKAGSGKIECSEGNHDLLS
jgi:hypothetical protein